MKLFDLLFIVAIGVISIDTVQCFFLNNNKPQPVEVYYVQLENSNSYSNNCHSNGPEICCRTGNSFGIFTQSGCQQMRRKYGDRMRISNHCSCRNKRVNQRWTWNDNNDCSRNRL